LGFWVPRHAAGRWGAAAAQRNVFLAAVPRGLRGATWMRRADRSCRAAWAAHAARVARAARRARTATSQGDIAVNSRDEALGVLELGPATGDDVEEIKRAFKRKVLECHPDRPEGSVQRFRLVMDAYALLIGAPRASGQAAPSGTERWASAWTANGYSDKQAEQQAAHFKEEWNWRWDQECGYNYQDLDDFWTDLGLDYNPYTGEYREPKNLWPEEEEEEAEEQEEWEDSDEREVVESQVGAEAAAAAAGAARADAVARARAAEAEDAARLAEAAEARRLAVATRLREEQGLMRLTSIQMAGYLAIALACSVMGYDIAQDNAYGTRSLPSAPAPEASEPP